MASMRNHYDNLKVARNAPTEVIEAAYRALVEKCRASSSRDSVLRARKIIDSAYFVLSDPLRRKQHDEWIRQFENQSLFERSIKQSINRLVASVSLQRDRCLAYFRSYHLHATVFILGILVAWSYCAPWFRQEDTVRVFADTHPAQIYTPTSPSTVPLSVPAALASKNSQMRFGPNENIPSIQHASSPLPLRGRQDWVRVGEPVPISSRMSHNWRLFDPNGDPWPQFSGPIYIPPDVGCATRVGDGLASTTIDNTGNSYNVFVKLVANPDNPKHCSVAWEFVKAREKRTIDGVNAGQYSLFVRDLNSGATEMTPSESLNSYRNDTEEGGTRYFVTLYTRPDGQIRPVSVSNDQFDDIDGHRSIPANSMN